MREPGHGLSGIPRRKPFMAQIHIGASIIRSDRLGRVCDVILTSNKHSWPIIKPVDGNGKTVPLRNNDPNVPSGRRTAIFNQSILVSHII